MRSETPAAGVHFSAWAEQTTKNNMARKIKGTEPRVTANLGIEAETLRRIEILTLQMLQKKPKARRGDLIDHLVSWALAHDYHPNKK